ncbi:hypothetical protein [Bartonella schoenbuchensis]
MVSAVLSAAQGCGVIVVPCYRRDFIRHDDFMTNVDEQVNTVNK